MSQPTDSARIEQQMALVNQLTQAFAYVINCHGEAVNQAKQGNLTTDSLDGLVGSSLNMLEVAKRTRTMVLMESGTSLENDKWMLLTSPDRNLLNLYLNNIAKASSAIGSCADLLFKFMIDDDCGDEIPDKVKSNYIRGGMLESIMIAANRISSDVELLGSRIDRAEDDDADGDEGQGGAR